MEGVEKYEKCPRKQTSGVWGSELLSSPKGLGGDGEQAHGPWTAKGRVSVIYRLGSRQGRHVFSRDRSKLVEWNCP